MLKIILSLLLTMLVSAPWAQTSTNVDNLSNNQQGNNVSSNSNNVSNTNSTTYNGNAPGSTPPPSAIAPSLMSGGQDSCIISLAGAVSSTVVGVSIGSYRRDTNCEMLKLSKALNDFGLKIAAVAVLCQDPRVFQAMAMAGTPCPYLGTIGKQATLMWQQNPEMRPDYETKPLMPISIQTQQSSDDSGTLSDRFRYSKRTNSIKSNTANSSSESTER